MCARILSWDCNWITIQHATYKRK